MMHEKRGDLPELPKGWVWTSLGEISINITKGSTPTSYGYSYKHDGINFIKTENINKVGVIENITFFIDEETNEFLKRSILKPKDILFSIAGTIGRVGVVQESHSPANTNQALGIVRCFWDLINNQYLFYFLKSPFVQNQVLDSIVGVGRANVSLTNLREIPVLFPPFPEQHRIIAKIEKLFTKLDAGVDSLKKVNSQLKRYRQSVLKSAMEGKLTKEWREAHKDEIEPASVLFERIKEEKRKNEKGKYKVLSPIDTTDLPELPREWVWTRTGEICDISMGQSPKGESYNTKGEGIPLINGPVEFGPTPFSHTREVKYTTNPTKMCKKDDLILCVRGSTTGRMNIAGFGACIGRGVASIRTLVNQWFVNYYFHFHEKNLLNIGTGSTFPNISSTQIAEYFIPLPPLIEQPKIVEEVERHLSIADEIEKVVKQGLKQSERLRQSILKKAFSGKLVPQDPTDEPASVLLERIKIEKAQKEVEQKEKKKNRKTKKKHPKQMELI